MQSKACKKCGEVKPLSSFYKASKESKDGLRGECKCCNKAATKARRNGPKRQEILDTQISGQMKRLYGIDLPTYNQMLEDQGGKCAICGTTKPGHAGKRFCIDHDHATGKVRGLLCMPCNVSIGHFRDDLTLIQNALDYVRIHKDH